MRFPSASVWVVCVTAWAEYGAFLTGVPPASSPATNSLVETPAVPAFTFTPKRCSTTMFGVSCAASAPAAASASVMLMMIFIQVSPYYCELFLNPHETDGPRQALFPDQQVGIDRVGQAIFADRQPDAEHGPGRHPDAHQLSAPEFRRNVDQREKFGDHFPGAWRRPARPLRDDGRWFLRQALLKQGVDRSGRQRLRR